MLAASLGDVNQSNERRHQQAGRSNRVLCGQVSQRAPQPPEGLGRLSQCV